MARAFSSSEGDWALLVGVVVVHADHVVFEERAALGEARLVVEIVVARVHVAEHRMARDRRLPPRRYRAPVRQPLPAGQVDRQRHAGEPLGAGGAAQRLSLLGGEILADADLADRPIATPVPSPPPSTSPHDLVARSHPRHLRDTGGCAACEIIAGAHDDLETGHSRSPQLHADRGRCRNRSGRRPCAPPSAGSAAVPRSRGHRRRASIVPVDVGVHAQFADDPARPAARAMASRSGGKGISMTRTSRARLLVHQRDAHFVDRDGPARSSPCRFERAPR